MAKGNLKVEVNEFFTQTRLCFCSTKDCVNRKDMRLECNLKHIEIRDGKCNSLIEKKRSDIIPHKPWPRG